MVATLSNIVTKIDTACQKQLVQQYNANKNNKNHLNTATGVAPADLPASSQQQVPWNKDLRDALEELTSLLEDESTVSAYELHSSGLIQILLKLFACHSGQNETSKVAKKSAKLQKQRVEIFQSCFNGDSSTELIRKLVSVLESIEKLPILLYDQTASGKRREKYSPK